MRVRRSHVLLAVVVVLYALLRLPLITHMNEYSDYDEGTYLLIARLINSGHLPYRDIYAVHPPLLYYLLALWLRIFGDGYVSGRLLSLTAGLVSVLMAYLTGKELENRRLGLFFALVVSVDPLMVLMNSLVYHESLIAMFTLLSLYSFVRYIKLRRFEYALLSVFLAGLGSTVKFTILPYLAALYLTLLLMAGKTGEQSAAGAVRVFFNREQFSILFLAYTIFVSIAVALVVLFPTKLTRLLIMTPGFGSVKFTTQVAVVVLFLTLWMALTVYAFNLSYIRRFLELTKELVMNWKPAVLLFLAAVAGKAIVEIPLGIAVSGNYIDQTYLSQGGRYVPFIGLFQLFHDVLTSVQSSSYEFLYQYVLMIALISAYLLLSLREKHSHGNLWVRTLALLSILFYLIIFPVIPNGRFLYPLFLVSYLALLEGINVGGRKGLALLISVLLVVGAVDYGLALNYTQGKLKLAYAPHSKVLRDELGRYIKDKGLDGAYYAINPMNAYYLNLSTPSYPIDSFGMLYLRKMNASSLISLLLDDNVSYVILSTWMYAIEKESPALRREYGELTRILRENYTLEYADSYQNGEVIELYSLKGGALPVGITGFEGKVAVFTNGSVRGTILAYSGCPYGETLIERSGNHYTVFQKSSGNSCPPLVYNATLHRDSVVFGPFPYAVNVTLDLNEIALPLTNNGTGVVFLTENGRIGVYGCDVSKAREGTAVMACPQNGTLTVDFIP